MAQLRLNPRLPNSNICELTQYAIKTSFHQAITVYDFLYIWNYVYICQKDKDCKVLNNFLKSYLSVWDLPKYIKLYSELHSA